MAQNDIDFTGKLWIDTSEASANVQKLAKDIDNLFVGTANKIRNRLIPVMDPNAFASQRGANPLGVADVASESAKKLEKLLKSRSKNSIAGLYAASKLSGQVNPIDRLEGIISLANSIGRYDNIMARTETLAGDIINRTIDSKAASGKYGALQYDLGRYIGYVNRVAHLYPEIVPEAAREEAYATRDMNRRLGAGVRAENTYLFNKNYWGESVASAIQAKMAEEGSTLAALADFYGVGFGAKWTEDRKNKVESLLEEYSDSLSNIKDRRERIESGNLSKAQRNTEFKQLTAAVTNLVRVGKNLGGEAKKNALAIKENTDLFVAEKKAAYANQAWRDIGGAAILASVLHAGAGMLQSYWGESIPRNVYASKQAYYKRWEIGGQTAGLTIGSTAGFALAGPIGAAVGAAIGNALGPLYGQYKQTKVQSDVVSVNAMIQRIRNQSLYGANYNSWFAQAMSDITGGDGMAELADKSMSLRARMMLGQVSEYDMLYYSMMPNYYAALMSGVTGERLASIYASDLKNIGDPSMRYVVGQAIGGTNAYAMANNKYFGAAYGTLAGYSRKYEEATRPLEPGFASSLIRVGTKNIEKQYRELGNTANRSDIDFFTSGNPYSWVSRFTNTTAGQLVLGALGLPAGAISKAGDTVSYSKENGVTFVNIITLDGEEIKKDIKTADEVYIDSWSQYSGA